MAVKTLALHAHTQGSWLAESVGPNSHRVPIQEASTSWEQVRGRPAYRIRFLKCRFRSLPGEKILGSASSRGTATGMHQSEARQKCRENWGEGDMRREGSSAPRHLAKASHQQRSRNLLVINSCLRLLSLLSHKPGIFWGSHQKPHFQGKDMY